MLVGGGGVWERVKQSDHLYGLSVNMPAPTLQKHWFKKKKFDAESKRAAE